MLDLNHTLLLSKLSQPKIRLLASVEFYLCSPASASCAMSCIGAVSHLLNLKDVAPFQVEELQTCSAERTLTYVRRKSCRFIFSPFCRMGLLLGLLTENFVPRASISSYIWTIFSRYRSYVQRRCSSTTSRIVKVVDVKRLFGLQGALVLPNLRRIRLIASTVSTLRSATWSKLKIRKRFILNYVLDLCIL